MVRKSRLLPADRAAIRERRTRLPSDSPARYQGYEAVFAEWATSLGWDVTKRGWPDFICRRDGALMAVEVKGGNDDLSPEQIDVLNDLAAAGLPTYVYHHELGLRRWPGRKTDSPASLREEIGRLHELIRRVVQERDEMIPGVARLRPPEWDFQAELDIVIDWCRAKHRSHNRYGTRMTTCSWVYFFHEQEHKTFEEIVVLMGEGQVAHIRNLHRKARLAVEAAKRSAAA